MISGVASLLKGEQFVRSNPFIFALFCGVGLGSIWWFNWQVSKQLTYYDDDWGEDEEKPYFIAHDTPPDGNCLFSSIAMSRKFANGGNPPWGEALRQSAGVLRKAAVGYLKNHGQKTPSEDEGSTKGKEITGSGPSCCTQENGKQSSTGGAKKSGGGDDEVPIDLLVELYEGETFERYCMRMKRNGEWGSAAEILALARTFQRPISVWICKRDYHDPMKTVVREARIPYGRFGFFSPPTINVDLARISVYGQEFLKEGVPDWDLPIMFNDLGSHYLALQRNPAFATLRDQDDFVKASAVELDEAFDKDDISMKGGGNLPENGSTYDNVAPI